ncbi:hypothetical protein ABTI69_22005, partial [Acinetobacter baumannii]
SFPSFYWTAPHQVFQRGGRTGLFESAGRVSKKAQSQSIRGGIIPKINRFDIISSLKDMYPITWLVAIAQVSRAGYYRFSER